jgi:hypothetical protein
VKRHFTTAHPKHADMTADERKRAVTRLRESSEQQRNTFSKQSSQAESNTRASYEVSLQIAKHLKPFSTGEFVKSCMLSTVDAICPEKKELFAKVSLSRPTVTRRIEEMASDMRTTLKKACSTLRYFSLALDESTDIKDTSQLSVFIRGVYDDLTTFEEFAEVYLRLII